MRQLSPIQSYFQLEEGTLTSYTYQMDTNGIAREAGALCKTLSEGQDHLARELLARVAGRWPLCVLFAIAEHGGPLRFSQTLQAVEGISQKVLTQTLRQLERDGLVTRTLYPQVPPRVDYDLTPLGRDLLAAVFPLFRWVAGRIGDFESARQCYDQALTEAVQPWPGTASARTG